MIERLIGNWLNSISEREFDVPFRILLEQLGFVVYGDTTIHGMAELGKDVVAVQSETDITFFFQVKSGDATLSDWNDMERQLRQLVEVPYIHPNYQIGDKYQPVWVLTGQMQEAVRLSLGLEVDRYRAEGRPTIEVWDYNTLLNHFKSTFYDVSFAEGLFLIEFMRLWSHAIDYHSDEIELRNFLRKYLSDLSDSNDRQKMRNLATYSLILTQLGQRYISLDNLFSAIDVTVLGLTAFSESIITNKLSHNIYADTLGHLTNYLEQLLKQFVTECNSDETDNLNLFNDQLPSLSEIIQYPLRVHSYASKVALSLILNHMNSESITIETNLLREILKSNPTFSHFISERQVGTYWVVIIALLIADEKELASQLLADTLDWLMAQHSDWGRGLLSPYESYDAVVTHLIDINISPNTVEWNRRGHSYALTILVKLATILDCKQDIEEHWHTISVMNLAYPRPTTEESLFAPLSEDVQNLQIHFPPYLTWDQLVEAFSERLDAKSTLLVDKHPAFLLYLALAYPWRTQWRETERYLDS